MFFAVLVGAYWLGAIPSALLVARLLHLPDPRTYGSGNVGATNMARGGSRSGAILTLLADSGKGAAAVFAATALLQGEAAASAAAAATAGVLAVLGHITSPFLRFRGGRGVATTLAVLVCWQPLLGAAVLAVWGAVFALCRTSSIASLTAATAATLLFFFFAPVMQCVAAALLNVLIVLRHWDNLRRLIAGKEGRFGS